MRHLGDITKIDWSKVEPPDVIIGGSPCQNLSVAGDRTGLAGSESSLFYEQVRCVKELRKYDAIRKQTNDPRRLKPRYMLWENVKGSLSSPGKDHAGEDFQAVLSQIVRIAEPDAPNVPLPEKRKWPYAGVIMGEGGTFSIAWRCHNAEFWGVAQRRERLSVLVDLAGTTAPGIMFDPRVEGCTENGEPIPFDGFSGNGCRPPVSAQCESMSGNSKSGIEEREKSAAASETGPDGTSERDRGSVFGFDGYNQAVTGSRIKTLNSIRSDADHVPIVFKEVEDDTAYKEAISFRERAGKPGGGKGILIQEDKLGSLGTSNSHAVLAPNEAENWSNFMNEPENEPEED